ncbi:hypothetical protein CC80DRAFT_491712 [Byssothecium circinans]|uniref:Berberine/berberine-like domain-containing protein n=1 Tax=Byssothecium circinans TaxID=147558 RepID=A0A6A5TZ78_9PLEO|nr:hypothetical protein CC80DRAFT_491712 [Byssothecium circinans]
MTPTILSRIHSIWEASALSMNKITTITSSMTLQSVPPPPPSDLPNSLGFSSDSTPEKDVVLCLIPIFFENSDAQGELDVATQDVIHSIDQVAEQEKASKKFTYLNYAARWQNPLRDYGSHVFGDLQQVAKKYDPQGIFQDQVGGFKLFREKK